jgi:hypothetical protein
MQVGGPSDPWGSDNDQLQNYSQGKTLQFAVTLAPNRIVHPSQGREKSDGPR